MDNIQAGTRPYLDPFLADRKPPRWDLNAERYAAAVTLHEMLAGTPPIFGDGVTDPSMTIDEATISEDRFDPALRDGLRRFFERALKRDPSQRFGNAEEMLRAWRQAFAPWSATRTRRKASRSSPAACTARAASRNLVTGLRHSMCSTAAWASTPSTSCWTFPASNTVT